ncbi:MAG: molybdopterin-binding protein [Spirochaetes bacterium]|nr:molybdopterin-binding protein [Spirochaetota bacterium]
MARVIAVCTSEQKGERKQNRGQAIAIEGMGLEGDAHAGYMHRQISLLAIESINRMRFQGLNVGPGDFAENITTEGIPLHTLSVGQRLRIGKEVYLRVTQIGKECHTRCAIYQQTGDCVMPKEGIFAEVLKGGVITVDDPVVILPSYRFAVLTASDKGSRGEREDTSGAFIKRALLPIGDTVRYQIVPDEEDRIVKEIEELCDVQQVDLILTTGGTGFSPRDVTPEATRRVIQREVPGIPEALRMESMKKTPRAILSRGIAGIRGKTLIINLPGSTKAVEEHLTILFPLLEHALGILTGKEGECGGIA